MEYSLEQNFSLKLSAIGLVSKSYAPDVNKYGLSQVHLPAASEPKYAHIGLNGYIFESKKKPEEKKFIISIRSVF